MIDWVGRTTVCCREFQPRHQFGRTLFYCVAVCCSVLQCVLAKISFSTYFSLFIALQCSALQCIAVCCSVLQCIAVYCSLLQCVSAQISFSTYQSPSFFFGDSFARTVHDTYCESTMCYNVLHYNILQHIATHCNTDLTAATSNLLQQLTALHCNTLQHATTRCNTGLTATTSSPPQRATVIVCGEFCSRHFSSFFLFVAHLIGWYYLIVCNFRCVVCCLLCDMCCGLCVCV